MSNPLHHKNDFVRVTATFTNVDGDLVDPTTITLKVLDPSGNTDTYTFAGGTVSKDSTGSYYKDVTVDEAGRWLAWWESTGSGQGGEPTQWTVEGNPF